MSVDQSSGDKVTDGRTDLRVVEGTTALPDARIGIVAAKWNDTIVNPMLAASLAALAEQEVSPQNTTVVWVPGSYEIPVTAQRMAASGEYDAIITFGCVIRGDTPHFDYVAGECARGVTEVALEFGIPVIFGVLTVENLRQAEERAGLVDPDENKGRDVTLAALEMVDVLRRLET